MAFVLQVYAPREDEAFHRALYDLRVSRRALRTKANPDEARLQGRAATARAQESVIRVGTG